MDTTLNKRRRGGNKTAWRPGHQQLQGSTQVVLPTETHLSEEHPLRNLGSWSLMATPEGPRVWALLCNCAMMVNGEALRRNNGCLRSEGELVSFLESTRLRFEKRGGK